MKRILCLSFVFCALLLCAGMVEAAQTTSSRQALMSGMADGATSAQSSRSAKGNAVPGSAGVRAESANLQDANTMHQQPGRPSGSTMSGQASTYRPAVRQSIPQQAPPAWAQTTYPAPLIAGLQPFGANLFQGNFANTYQEGLQPDYVIAPGDRILIRVWGAFSYDDVLVVDQQGNVFVPEVGPIAVAGLRHSQLQGTIQRQIASVFTSNVQIYTNLMSSQPVAVFVTGHVLNPGRYAGGQRDSILYYLDRAGGIVAERGSYRHVTVKRNGTVIASVM